MFLASVSKSISPKAAVPEEIKVKNRWHSGLWSHTHFYFYLQTSWEPSVQTFKEYCTHALPWQKNESGLTGKRYECAVEQMQFPKHKGKKFGLRVNPEWIASRIHHTQMKTCKRPQCTVAFLKFVNSQAAFSLLLCTVIPSSNLHLRKFS